MPEKMRKYKEKWKPNKIEDKELQIDLLLKT